MSIANVDVVAEVSRLPTQRVFVHSQGEAVGGLRQRDRHDVAARVAHVPAGQDAHGVPVPARQLPAPAVLRRVAVPADERAQAHLAVPRVRPPRALRLAGGGRVSDDRHSQTRTVGV